MTSAHGHVRRLSGLASFDKETAIAAPTNYVELSGYVPDAIGRVTALHASCYHQHRDFELWFEAKAAATPNYRSSWTASSCPTRPRTATG